MSSDFFRREEYNYPIGIKPLIHVDENGKLVAMGKPRGKKKALQALLTNMEQS